MKTNKAMAKRFKVTKTGKLKYKKAGARHLKSNKSGKRVRQFRIKEVIEGSSASTKRVLRALGR